MGCHEHGADAAGMDAWAWNQNPSISKNWKRDQAFKLSSCLYTHWESQAGKTGAWQLPQTGKCWLGRGCRAIGRGEGAGSKCHFHQQLLQIIPMPRSHGLAQILPKVAAGGHHGNLIPQSFCPCRKSHCASCWTRTATGSWCWVVACLISPKLWLKVFPSLVYPK